MEFSRALDVARSGDIKTYVRGSGPAITFLPLSCLFLSLAQDTVRAQVPVAVALRRGGVCPGTLGEESAIEHCWRAGRAGRQDCRPCADTGRARDGRPGPHAL